MIKILDVCSMEHVGRLLCNVKEGAGQVRSETTTSMNHDVVLVSCSVLVIFVEASVLRCMCRETRSQRKLQESVNDKLYHEVAVQRLVRYPRELSQRQFLCMRTTGELGQLSSTSNGNQS